MKVNHKTFSGGYQFPVFEGQPGLQVRAFKGDAAAELVIKPEDCDSASDVLDALKLTGFNGPDSALVSTEGVIDPGLVKDILISAVEVEPYDLPVAAMVKEENIGSFVDGLKKIHESYGQSTITLVAGDKQEALQNVLFPLADNLSWFNVATIKSLYPANMKEVQIPAVLGKRYPVGYDPAHIGVLFIGVEDVLAISKVMADGHPAKAVKVALAGIGWKENLVLSVPVGTSLKSILSAYKAEGAFRIIKNSVMTGSVLDEEDIISYDTKTIIAIPEDEERHTLFFLRPGAKSHSFTNSFIGKFLKNEKRADTNLHGERRAAVSIGYAQDLCPAETIPHLLHQHVDKKIINERLAEYKIFDCVECGICDYVCPSKIEVSSDIKQGKKMLEAEGISQNQYVIPFCDMVRKPEEVSADE